AGGGCERRQARAELAEARVPVLEGEAQIGGDLPRLLEQSRGAGLSEVDHLAVVAEIFLCQLRVAIDAEPPDHEPLEVAREEVRQVERTRLVIGQLGEGARASEKLIAVRARQPL